MQELKPKRGFQDGVPIALGYFAVSLAFGVATVSYGFPIWTPILISITNFTGSGQALGVQLMASGAATLVELFIAMLIINIRYALMSVSIGQMLSPKVTLGKRFLIAFGMTDENFAVAVSHNREISFGYMITLELTSFAGWVLGTVVGAVVGNFLPEMVMIAFKIALPAMFVAIVIPPCGKSRAILSVVIIAVAMSCLFYYVPGLNTLSKGWVYVICGLSSATIGAILFPVNDKSDDNNSEPPQSGDSKAENGENNKADLGDTENTDEALESSSLKSQEGGEC